MAEFEDISLEEESFDFDPTSADVFELEVVDFREQTDVNYPAVVLSRVLFRDCLLVLQARKRQSYREMETWVELPDGDGFQKIGTLQMDSDMLLTLRHLRIGVTLYYNNEEMEVLNLEDPEVLERFV